MFWLVVSTLQSSLILIVRFIRSGFELQDFWNNVLCSGKSKVEISGYKSGFNTHHHIWCKHSINTSAQTPHTRCQAQWWTVIWACFAVTGSRDFTVIELTMNISVYKSIVEPNLSLSVRELKLCQNIVMQQDNDFKHSGESTIELVKKDVTMAESKSRTQPDWNLCIIKNSCKLNWTETTL